MKFEKNEIPLSNLEAEYCKCEAGRLPVEQEFEIPGGELLNQNGECDYYCGAADPNLPTKKFCGSSALFKIGNFIDCRGNLLSATKIIYIYIYYSI